MNWKGLTKDLWERLVHTPEGVRDIYGKEYANKQNIQKLLARYFIVTVIRRFRRRLLNFLMCSAVKSARHPPKELYKFF